MGMNIHVKDKSGNDHPEWDWIRYGNDDEFTEIIDWKQVDRFEELFRPRNIEQLKEKIKSTDWLNQERYLKLLQYVQDGWWLYFSY